MAKQTSSYHSVLTEGESFKKDQVAKSLETVLVEIRTTRRRLYNVSYICHHTVINRIH